MSDSYPQYKGLRESLDAIRECQRRGDLDGIARQCRAMGAWEFEVRQMLTEVEDLRAKLSSSLSAKEAAEAQIAVLAEAAQRLVPYCRESNMTGETPWEQAWLKMEAALTASVQSLAEQWRKGREALVSWLMLRLRILNDHYLIAYPDGSVGTGDTPRIEAEREAILSALRSAKGESQPPEERRNG